MQPAIALLELDSIAIGIETGDAMAKRSPIDVIYAGTVHPGKYLVLVGGAVADVEAAVELGRARIGAPGRAISRVIPQLHGEMRDNLAADARFRSRIAGRGEG